MDTILAILVLILGYYARVWLKSLKERKMSKIISIMITLVVTLFAFNALAFDPPPPPSDGFYVVDLAGKLSDSQKSRLNQKIEQVNRATKNEFGVLLLSDMGGDNIEDVANATYKKWGIGKRGLDNGCLIVVSIKERKSRIETGKGVEGDVPDLKANDILKKNLNPHLKTGDFYGGFDDTLGALQSQIESRHAQKADPSPASTGSSGCDVSGAVGSGFGLFFLVVAGLLGVMVFFRHRARKAEEAEARRVSELRTAERLRRLREQNELREALDAQRAKAAREAAMEKKMRISNIPTPPIEVPIVTRPAVPRPSVRPRPVSTPPSSPPPRDRSADAAAAVAAAASAASLMERRKREEAQKADDKRRREAEARAEREREERRARERRDEDDRRRRRQEEESRSSSSSSSSSSFDWGSSSSDSGSGFGGGDSGGGGSSSDW